MSNDDDDKESPQLEENENVVVEIVFDNDENSENSEESEEHSVSSDENNSDIVMRAKVNENDMMEEKMYHVTILENCKPCPNCFIEKRWPCYSCSRVIQEQSCHCQSCQNGQQEHNESILEHAWFTKQHIELKWPSIDFNRIKHGDRVVGVGTFQSGPNFDQPCLECYVYGYPCRLKKFGLCDNQAVLSYANFTYGSALLPKSYDNFLKVPLHQVREFLKRHG